MFNDLAGLENNLSPQHPAFPAATSQNLANLPNSSQPSVFASQS
jgi:hypothetical protein